MKVWITFWRFYPYIVPRQQALQVSFSIFLEGVLELGTSLSKGFCVCVEICLLSLFGRCQGFFLWNCSVEKEEKFLLPKLFNGWPPAEIKPAILSVPPIVVFLMLNSEHVSSTGRSVTAVLKFQSSAWCCEYVDPG